MKTTIYQNEDRILQDTQNAIVLQPLFVDTTGVKGFETEVCKLYKFKSLLFFKDLLVSDGNLYFGMSGDLSGISDVRYLSISNLGGELSGRNSQMFNINSFSRSLINQTISNDDAQGIVLIEGTFKSDSVSFIVPSIGFDATSGGDTLLKGSYFEIE